MNRYINVKDVFGREYRFIQLEVGKELDLDFISSNNINAGIVVNKESKDIEDIQYLQEFHCMKAINLGRFKYKNIEALSSLGNLEYLSFYGEAEHSIPFSSMANLWTSYLKYSKKNCKGIFDSNELENLFIDNYSEESSRLFENLHKLRRIGLMKCRILEFDAIQSMPNLEHFSIGYNSKITSLEWMMGSNQLRTIIVTNCRNIRNWECIGSLQSVEKIIIENCGEIPSLNFIKKMPKIRELRIIGNATIEDKKLKDILSHPTLSHFFVPIQSGYDITLEELRLFNNNLPLTQ